MSADLTPTEYAAEAMIRRDPLRRMPMDALREQLRQAEMAVDFYAGTSQQWRSDMLRDRVEAIHRELSRRRAC